MADRMEQARIFNPWNSNNKLIPTKAISDILKKYGYKMHSADLFRQASIHKSYVNRPDLWLEQSQNGEPMVMAERPPNCLPLQEADNEELEFVGDSILGCIVALYLYQRYPGQGEGFLTRLRTQIVNNKMLGVLALKLGFAQWIVISRHVEEFCDGRKNLRILGSMLESWIGALFMSENAINPGKGFEATQAWLVNVIEEHIDIVSLIQDNTNYKDQLLRWFQAKFHQTPRYKEVSVDGPPHDRVFTMGVLDINDKVVATASARNKKLAEQEASRLALEILAPHEESLASSV
jgi:ribonuclease-3